MLNYIRKHQQTIILTGAIVLLILSRFVNINQSARFIWDESDDLVRMYKIFQAKKITLVGPINTNDNTGLFGSLTYYMLLPVTILFNFDPIGPVAATAIFSILLILILGYLLYRKYHRPMVFTLLFLTLSFPLVQAGRWAWNPHLVPFWQGLALAIFLFFYQKNNWYYWLSIGLFLGLAIHNHWYAFFPLVGFAFGLLFLAIKQKRLKAFFFFCVGAGLAILPFVLFDLRHPPGLFLTRLLYFGPLNAGKNQLNFSVWFNFFNYFFQNRPSTIIFLLLFFFYLTKFLRFSKDPLKKILLIPIAVHLSGLTLISPVFNHYFIPAVIFLLVFLLIPDKEKNLIFLQKVVIIVFFVLNIIPSVKEIKKDNWQTNIGSTREIVRILAANIPKNKKCNIYVPASPSADIIGKRYRDLLFIKNIHLMSKEDFRDYQCLFAVSTSGVERVKKDAAYELDLIRNKRPKSTWQVAKSPWFIYYFEL